MGDWIAGFSTKALAQKTKNVIKQNGLIYLMKVGRIMTLDEYYQDKGFAKKKPVFNHKNDAIRAGDNIYYKIRDEYVQHKNNSHGPDPETVIHDVSGENVLIADMDSSFYFGDQCLIPEKGWEHIGFNISSGRTFYRKEDQLENLLTFIRQKYQPGIHGNPCLKPPIDDEMKTFSGKSCSA